MKRIKIILAIFLCFSVADIIAQQSQTEKKADEKEKTEKVQSVQNPENPDFEKRSLEEQEIDLRFYTGSIDPNAAVIGENLDNEANADTRFAVRQMPDLDLSDFPRFIDTGNLEHDLEVYDMAKKLWIDQNPDKYKALQK